MDCTSVTGLPAAMSADANECRRLWILTRRSPALRSAGQRPHARPGERAPDENLRLVSAERAVGPAQGQRLPGSQARCGKKREESFVEAGIGVAEHDADFFRR